MEVFKKSFSEKVDSLRKSLVDLFIVKSASVSDSMELKRIESEWLPYKEEIAKGNVSTVLSVLDKKFDVAVKDIRKSLESKAVKQESLRKDIVKVVKDTPSLVGLLLGEDFISETRYNEIACQLVKGHKSGVVSDESLKKLISYKRDGVPGKDGAFVKDTRTQYADMVIINDKNEILFTIRNKNDKFCPGGYCLPGGHIEPNEEPMDAALRECLEETGIALKTAEIEPLGEYLDNKSHIYYFIARKDVEPVVLQSEEQIQWEKVSFDKIGEKPLIMNLEVNLKNLLADLDEDNATIVYKSGEIKKGLESVPDLMGLSGRNTVRTASGDFVVFDEACDILEKARGNLVRKKVFVTRNGKTFLTTVYVNPQGDIVQDTHKDTEVDSKVDLTGIALDDTVALQTSQGSMEGKIVSIRQTARDGVFMSICDSLGRLHTAYAKNIKSVNRITSTVKVGGQSSAPAQTPLQPIKTSNKKKDWLDFLTSNPLDTSKFTRLGGSGDNYLCSFDGGEWVLKKERFGKEGHLASESRADFVYRAMGFDAPDSSIVSITEPVTGAVEDYKTNEYVRYKSLGALTGQARKDAMKEVAKGFALDALLGNWDVVGTSGDNILVKPDGSVYRMDNGASFEYRARGSKKDLSDFLNSSVVSEIESMRTGFQASPATKEAYSSLTDEDICKQIDDLEKQRSRLMSAMDACGAPANVKDAISRRLDYMVKWAKSIRNQPQPGQWDVVTDPNMPSGVTEHYFSNWEDLKFDVPQEFLNKDVLKDNIIEMEKKLTPGMKRVAKELGMTVGEYKHKLQELFEQAVAVMEPFSCTKQEIFHLICQPGGRYKSTFEVHDSGIGYENDRAETEFHRYGFKEDRKYKPEHRMVCGYITNNGYGAYNDNSGGSIINGIPPTANGYGHIIVKMKKEVALKRGTFVCANSLNNYNSHLAVPFAKPHFAALNGIADNAKTAEAVMKELEDFASGKIRRMNVAVGQYMEMQYHDGLHREDIECINLCENSHMLDKSEITDIVNVLISNGFSKVKIFTANDVK